jgi:hypothetical protein
MPHDLNILPKWARDRIRALEQNVAHAQQELLIARGETPTPVWVGTTLSPEWNHEPKGYAPLGTPIRIYLRGEGPDANDQNWVEVQRSKDGQYVVVSSASTIMVKPWVSNVVHVYQAEGSQR